MRITPLILIAALALPAALAGCTTTDNGDPDLPADVDMKNNKFVPETYEVEVGETVVWKNLDSIGHTVTPFDSDKWGTEGSGNDPSDYMNAGDTYSFTFTEPGTYEYRCIPHSWEVDGGYDGMVGTIVVGGGDNTTADTTGDDGNNTTA